jgi:hypothetical protein
VKPVRADGFHPPIGSVGPLPILCVGTDFAGTDAAVVDLG